MSLKSEIVELAKREYPNWWNGGRAEKLAMDLQYKPSNASRRCRELVNEGILEHRYNEQGCVEYRLYMKTPTPEEQKVDSEKLLQMALM